MQLLRTDLGRVVLRQVIAAFVVTAALGVSRAQAQDVSGAVTKVDVPRNEITIQHQALHREVRVQLTPDVTLRDADGKPLTIAELESKLEEYERKGIANGLRVTITSAMVASSIGVLKETPVRPFFQELTYNIQHNLFKPLLLFFYMGFLVPFLKIKFEFPYVMYQALTIYLLIAIGWHGGEELAQLDPNVIGSVAGFMGVGFVTNTIIGFLAYGMLTVMTRMRRIDRATVAGYYGSDSAGTFVTALGVLAAVHISYDAYMPVMLAVMEIPGCLVALLLVSRLRQSGMDPAGTMPDEPGFNPNAIAPLSAGVDDGHGSGEHHVVTQHPSPTPEVANAMEEERELALEKRDKPTRYGPRPSGAFNAKMLHEVFFNPGLFLLFGGITIGFLSRLQGPDVVRDDDNFFNVLFQGVLCLFLLEMGMTASRKLKDLKTAGPGFVLFALIAPNLFALIGILSAHTYSMVTHSPFELGTYVLFAVLCGAASYIAVPAVQRLAIPEASPTLPLAASLGLTFSYNVTVGIPLYIEIARAITHAWPVIAV